MQIGLQGILFSLFNLIFRISNPDTYISVFYSLNVFLLCILLFLYLHWVRAEFGLWSAVLSYFLLLMNNWFIVSARNLYWVTFTLILPFILVLLYHHSEENSKKKLSEKLLYTVTFIAIAIKSACGYEFISTVMVAAEIPIIYYAIKNKWPWRKSILRFCKNGIAAIAGFLFALCIHIVQCFLYYGKLSSAFQLLQYTITKRTGLGNIQVDEVYWDSLDASKLSVISEYMFKGRPIIWLLPMGVLLFAYMSGILASFVDKRYSISINDNRQKYLGLAVTFLISLSAPLSWYVLASGHSYIHVVINYLLWSLPCVLLGNTLFVSVSSALVRDNWKKVKIKSKLVIAVGIVLIFGFFYMDFCSKGITYLENCRTNGTYLASDDTMELYYYRNKVYIIANRNQSDENYFYHIYPKEESIDEIFSVGFDNCDFNFKDRELKTPFWYREKIAELKFKDFYLPEVLEIGQLSENQQVWNTTVQLPHILESPSAVTISNVSDANWTSGIFNDGTIILTDFRPEYTSLSGKYIETIAGEKVKISKMEAHPPYLHIVLEKSIDNVNGYPNSMKIHNK